MKLDAHTHVPVTGAGSGLGRAVALQLARRGARVGVGDRPWSDVGAADHRMAPGMVACDGG